MVRSDYLEDFSAVFRRHGFVVEPCRLKAFADGGDPGDFVGKKRGLNPRVLFLVARWQRFRERVASYGYTFLSARIRARFHDSWVEGVAARSLVLGR